MSAHRCEWAGCDQQLHGVATLCDAHRGEVFKLAGQSTAVAIAAAHGALLKARGKHARGPCPLCGGEKTSQRFQAEAAGPLWYCFACCQGGDAIKLELLLGGHRDKLDAARAIIGLGSRPLAAGATRPAEPGERERPASGLVGNDAVGAYIRRTAQRARGEIVEAWLRARGLDPEGVPGALDRLRFHPRCPVLPWRVDRDPESGWTAPAMVALLDVVHGPMGQREASPAGVHVTYLRASGREKAQLVARNGSAMPARRMWGPVRGAAFWLTDPDADGALIVGEGIETVWSYAQRQARPCRAAAVLALNNLQGGFRTLPSGALPLWQPVADPEKRPMLLADPGEVVVLVDADMKPVRMHVQHRRGERPARGHELGSLARAELCASLAAQHWRAAGASSVRCARPPIGQDFNDQMRMTR